MAPLDPQFRAVLDTLAAAGDAPLSTGTPAEARDHYRALAMARRGAGFVPEAVAAVEDRAVVGPGGAVPVRVYRPDGDRGSVVVYAHGGGWVIGDIETHDPVCRRVANALGAVVVSVGYRLAPEHPYPAALDDMAAVVSWAASYYPGRPLGVAGDSAGASLAAGAALRARDAGIVLAGQLLFYPATDPSQSLPAVTENGDGYFLSRRDMAWFFAQYAPTPGLAAAPEVDLLHADVAGVAPAVVATAEYDPLRDDGAAYAARLDGAGVQVTYVPGPGLIHGYLAFQGVVDAAEARGAEVLGHFARLLTPR